MSRTRVKICGVTRNEDALLAARLGADAIGLNFHSASPRAVTVDRISAILANLPCFISVVGLFVNPTERDVEKVIATGRIDCLQFHGEEPQSFCN
ncbi:MAG: N-(5'-phosphoribosyl)anthranilate isomerase, partial [Pseudohongiellaceae bacterium]